MAYYPTDKPIWGPWGNQARLHHIDGMLDLTAAVLPCHDRIIGVYFLCDTDVGNIVYVGKSKNMIERIMAHSDKKFDRVFAILLHESDIALVEAAFINHYHPKYNKVIPKIHPNDLAWIIEEYGERVERLLASGPPVGVAEALGVLNARTASEALRVAESLLCRLREEALQAQP
jgi:hypothetical protein